MLTFDNFPRRTLISFLGDLYINLSVGKRERQLFIPLLLSIISSLTYNNQKIKLFLLLFLEQ